MRNRRGIKRLASVVVAATAASGLVALTPTAAQATVPFSRMDVADVSGWNVVTAADGDVSVSGCGSRAGAIGIKTVTSSGSVVGTIPTVYSGSTYLPALMQCNDQKAVGANGTLYGVDSNNYPQDRLAAYQPDGLRLWAVDLGVPGCQADPLTPRYLNVGADGNLYVLGRPQYGQCGGRWQLYSFTSSGTQRWQQTIYGAVSFMGAYSQNDGGVALKVGSAIEYYGYDGTFLTGVATQGGNERAFGLNAAGMVAVVAYGYAPSTCGALSGSQVAASISGYTPAGRTIFYQPECSVVPSVAATVDGSIVYDGILPDSSSGIVRLRYETSTTVTPLVVLPSTDGVRSFVGGAGVIAETNGNVLAYRVFTHQNGQYRGTQFVLVGVDDGAVRAIFNTDSVSANKSITVEESTIGIAPGQLYFGMKECNDIWSCSSSDPVALVDVPMVELGMDYPRGAMLGVTATSTDDMAVVGDSFTSALGSLKSGQAYATGNCNRSPNAYGRLLEEDPSVMLRMPTASFTACAGAETQHVINQSFQGEGPQAGRIAPEAKSIFMTIGGNDAGFTRFSTLCVLYDCTLPAVAQEFSDKFQTLSSGDKLGNAYRAVLDRAPNATLYVIGYPQILPLQNCHDTGSAWWLALEAAYQLPPAVLVPMLTGAGLTSSEAAAAALMGAPSITDDELIAGNQMVNQLNLAISDAAAAVNAQSAYAGRIVYVSATAPGTPLGDRKLCSANPAFNGLDLANVGESLHPNASGQAELYLLARAALAAHQPQYVPLG